MIHAEDGCYLCGESGATERDSGQVNSLGGVESRGDVEEGWMVLARLTESERFCAYLH